MDKEELIKRINKMWEGVSPYAGRMLNVVYYCKTKGYQKYTSGVQSFNNLCDDKGCFACMEFKSILYKLIDNEEE